MRTLRREAGQTAAEYLGALLIVSVLIAGVATTDVGRAIRHETVRLVCVIAGGTSCDAESTRINAAQDRAERKAEDDLHGDRRIYTAGKTDDIPGKVVRVNGDGPSGNGEADAVFDNFGAIYDYYMHNFARSSYDGNGAPLIATIDYRQDPDSPFQNAYWDPERKQMVFGEGFAQPLDVTAHEVTHAITERASHLNYQGESGALNESISDIFGSNLDPDDWLIGEDLPGGAIRDMAHPERYGQPGNVKDYVKTGDDNGGVHTNSGIPNKAYVNMVGAIGRDASQQIVYATLTKDLQSDSGFEDFRAGCLKEAAAKYGKDSPQYKGVDKAFRDVGLDGKWRAPS